MVQSFALKSYILSGRKAANVSAHFSKDPQSVFPENEKVKTNGHESKCKKALKYRVSRGFA